MGGFESISTAIDSGAQGKILPGIQVYPYTIDTPFTMKDFKNCPEGKVCENHLGGNLGDYAKLSYVSMELEYANSIFKRHACWTKIDVTNKPIEEITMEILSGLRKCDG